MFSVFFSAVCGVDFCLWLIFVCLCIILKVEVECSRVVV